MLVSYVGETSLVQSEKTANGATLAYGYDSSDRVTAITQSTTEGEENSNQKYYTNGLVTRVKSGNNKVDYTYDYKHRLTKVGLNGDDDYVSISYSDDGWYWRR